MQPKEVTGHDEEAQLIEEILRFPELRYEGKGKRMREILQHLWEFRQRSPADAASSERLIADAVYSGLGDEEDSSVRRAVTRLRKFLDRLPAERLSKHSIRVRIPLREYRLEFYYPLVVNGLRPTQWFWKRYFDSSLDAGLVLIQPRRQDVSLPTDLSTTLIARLTRTFAREVQAFAVPDLQADNRYFHEPPSYRPFSSLDVRFVIAEEHGMLLGEYPEDGDDEYEYEVLRRKSLPLSKRQNRPLVNGLAISYAKVTRFTNPHAPHQQITLLDAEWAFPIKELVDCLTLDSFLQPLMSLPRFAGSVEEAPRKFQMLFTATLPAEEKGSPAQNLSRCPVLRAVTLGPSYVYPGTPAYPWKYVETRAL